MKSLKVRWRIWVNMLLLSTVLITSFQNCSKVDIKMARAASNTGVEVVTE